MYSLMVEGCWYLLLVLAHMIFLLEQKLLRSYKGFPGLGNHQEGAKGLMD